MSLGRKDKDIPAPLSNERETVVRFNPELPAGRAELLRIKGSVGAYGRPNCSAASVRALLLRAFANREKFYGSYTYHWRRIGRDRHALS